MCGPSPRCLARAALVRPGRGRDGEGENGENLGEGCAALLRLLDLIGYILSIGRKCRLFKDTLKFAVRLGEAFPKEMLSLHAHPPFLPSALPSTLDHRHHRCRMAGRKDEGELALRFCVEMIEEGIQLRPQFIDQHLRARIFSGTLSFPAHAVQEPVKLRPQFTGNRAPVRRLFDTKGYFVPVGTPRLT